MAKGSNFEIKTTLAIDGEKKFKQAMDDANLSMRVMDSEMKKVEAAYRSGGDGAEYYAQKSRILKNEVAQQEAIVDALRNAVAEAADKYGYASKEVQKFKIQQNNAEAALSKLTKESKKATKELDELGDESKRAGRQMEDGIGEGAQKAAEEADDAFGSIKDSLDELRNHAAVQTTLQVGQFIVDSIQSVVGFVDENAELTRQIAIAQYNVERYGMRWSEVEGLIVDAAAVTGDYEGSMAAITSLLQAGFSDVGLLEAAMNALLGGFLSRPGMSMETLAEDFLATVNTREVTGQMAELLTEVLAVATGEQINEALQGAQNTEEAMQIALSYLTQAGLQNRTAEFQAQNQQLIDYQAAALETAEKWRQLSQTMMPIVSAILEIINGWIDTLNDEIENRLIERGLREQGLTPTEAVIERVTAEYGSLENGEGTRIANQLQATIEAQEMGALEGRWHMFKAMLQDVIENWNLQFLPSAGAEEMPEGWETYGQQAYSEFEAGFSGAHEAGTSMIQEFGAGITEGSTEVLNNVGSMVNQINGMLGSVTFPSYGFGGVNNGNISLVVDGQELGRVTSSGVSSTIGSRVSTIMRMD